jgi:nicotinamidase/pyrazinamidase
MAGKWGVIVIDMQGDFTKWKQGSLAVPGSNEDYVKAVEEATRTLKDLGLPVIATQDWHPPNHVSFATSHPGKRPFEEIMIDGKKETLWPPHCVQGTENARVLPDNNLFLAIVKMSQDPTVENYSAFKDGRGVKTELDTVLSLNGVDKIIIYGIATEYVVRATALDLLAAGYKPVVVESLCRGVTRDTSANAIDEMKSRGIRLVGALNDIIEEVRRDLSIT